MKRFVSNTSGATSVEYGLIAVVVSIVIVTAINAVSFDNPIDAINCAHQECETTDDTGRDGPSEQRPDNLRIIHADREAEE